MTIRGQSGLEFRLYFKMKTFLNLYIFVSPSKQLIKLYKEPLEKAFGLLSVQSCKCSLVWQFSSALLLFKHQGAGFTEVQCPSV